jgi:dimethylhistidine N-methyltransferase
VAAAARISHAYPLLEVLPVCADFTQPFELPSPARAPLRTTVFFPGSTIGNFDRGPALDLLELMGSIAGADGALVIGVDLVKDPGILTRAYDDAAGVTAEFNLNVLRRLNREFGADFDLNAFAHAAVWVPAASRIEMHLVSLERQTVTLAGEPIEFARGEHLVTEHCHKYTVAGFEALAGEAGWVAQRVWTDPECRFSLHYFARRP